MDRGNEYKRERVGGEKLEGDRGGEGDGRRESYREMFVGESTQGVAVKGFLEAITHSS